MNIYIYVYNYNTPCLLLNGVIVLLKEDIPSKEKDSIIITTLIINMILLFVDGIV